VLEVVHINICIWVGGVTSSKLLEFGWERMNIQHDITIMFALSTDTCIHIQTKYATSLSVLNDIVVTGQVKYHILSS